MRKLLIALALFAGAACAAPVPFSFWKTAAPAGGPNAWYDGALDSAATANKSGSSNDGFWQAVTVAQAGSATKLRWYCRAHYGGSETIKLALYSSDGATLLGSGSVSVTSTGYFEANITPVAVTATTYQIATMFIGSSAECGMTGTSTFNANNSMDYPTFPPASLPSASSTPAGQLCVGVYVD